MLVSKYVDTTRWIGVRLDSVFGVSAVNFLVHEKAIVLW